MLTQKSLLDPVEFVVSHGKFVSIDKVAIETYANTFVPTKATHWTKSYPLFPLPKLSNNKLIDLFFLMGSQAFYFWGSPKWTMEYKGKTLDGWWALVACFHRAIERGIPITDGTYLAKLTLDKTRELFFGNPEIPFLSKRHQILRSIGKKLVDSYDGFFHNAFSLIDHDAFSLLKLLSEFRGFDDVSRYKGKRIPFYKKAQVVVSDINTLVAVKNIDLLPSHADYKIPAQLKKAGILRYSDELERMIDNQIEIPEGSVMEVEIRANMLWAIHLIVEKLKLRHPEIDANTLNGILWVQSQKKDAKDKPYHRTRTIYY